MDMPWLTEKVAEGRRNDRLQEADLARSYLTRQANGSNRLKLTLFLSGVVLVAVTIMIVQLM